MNRVRSAFSLLEVVLTVTIAAIVMSMTTLGMVHLSDESKLRAAATDLGSLLRLTQAQANTTGRPVALRFRQKDCELLKPVERDGQWVLAPVLRRELPGPVRIEKVGLGKSDPPNTGDVLCEVWVHPDGGAELAISLQVGKSGRARVTINAWVGLKEIKYLDGNQN